MVPDPVSFAAAPRDGDFVHIFVHAARTSSGLFICQPAHPSRHAASYLRGEEVYPRGGALPGAVILCGSVEDHFLVPEGGGACCF